jgi:hypothetical protein
VRQLTEDEVAQRLTDVHAALAVNSHLAVLRCLETHIKQLDRVILAQVTSTAAVALLKTVPGIGDILALTIWLETGPIERFEGVGNFASYGRCVDTKRLSHGKSTGKGNGKNGNTYLAWACIEAAHVAVRHDVRITRFSQRKEAKTNQWVAIKTVAHKLSRACCGMMRDLVPFDGQRAFGFCAKAWGWGHALTHTTHDQGDIQTINAAVLVEVRVGDAAWGSAWSATPVGTALFVLVGARGEMPTPHPGSPQAKSQSNTHHKAPEDASPPAHAASPRYSSSGHNISSYAAFLTRSSAGNAT